MAKKPTLLAVFAHPDDESFGPAGTLHLFTKTHDVYLICATDGSDPTREEELVGLREGELKAATDIIGIKKVYCLGYDDGGLNNRLYHDFAAKIQSFVDRHRPEILLTFEPNGISGHLDHVACSMVTSYVFRQNQRIKAVWQHCISREHAQEYQDYFIYFPPGYDRTQIDKVVDISPVFEIKLKAMQAHQSQIKDLKRLVESYQRRPKEEYFLILKH
jgi:N-acetylglucosamine malate deacetylase 2